MTFAVVLVAVAVVVPAADASALVFASRASQTCAVLPSISLDESWRSLFGI